MAALIGWTARVSASPLLHKVDDPPPRYSPKGKTFVAQCGAQIRYVHPDGTAAGRLCAKCWPKR